MENSNSVDVQSMIANFEAVIASGDVKLIAQNEEVKLYIGYEGTHYIYDGNQAYSENSNEFAQMKSQYFSGPNS